VKMAEVGGDRWTQGKHVGRGAGPKRWAAVGWPARNNMGFHLLKIIQMGLN
jgi:hypothetical protein